ncbi:MAG: hypothetical protein KF858_10300 [Candidatus Sumerlaeia bacterium]|nr:hypothetical protein [Candidatus Sumerlaeia bacterium]
MNPVHVRLAVRLVPLLIGLLLGACARTRSGPDAYSPHENLLSIAAEFELLASRDPYAQHPAVELTGQNIARATLVRLANYGTLHPGRFAPEVLTLKGRAYERLGDYEGARRAYIEAAEFDTPLREDCLRRAALDERLLAVRESAGRMATIEEMLRTLQRQAAEFNRLAQEWSDPEYRAYARVEAESTEVRRAELLVAGRWLLADGETQALEALRDLVAAHSGSRRGLEHALRLARYCRELAEEEMRLHPPETLDFNADRARRLLDESLDILQRVSQADGRPERLLAARELDAVLALRDLLERRAA